MPIRPALAYWCVGVAGSSVSLTPLLFSCHPPDLSQGAMDLSVRSSRFNDLLYYLDSVYLCLAVGPLGQAASRSLLGCHSHFSRQSGVSCQYDPIKHHTCFTLAYRYCPSTIQTSLRAIFALLFHWRSHMLPTLIRPPHHVFFMLSLHLQFVLSGSHSTRPGLVFKGHPYTPLTFCQDRHFYITPVHRAGSGSGCLRCRSSSTAACAIN